MKSLLRHILLQKQIGRSAAALCRTFIEGFHSLNCEAIISIGSQSVIKNLGL
jgi:hypothetical protein